MALTIKESGSAKEWVFIALCVVYLFTLGIRIYWIAQKTSFHIDEAFSVQLACYNPWWMYESNRMYTGEEAKDISLTCHHNVWTDVYYLWQSSNDTPHTNLYYSLLRFSLIGLDTGDIKQIIFRGGTLNLLFFTISFVFFFRLVRLLFPESPLLQTTATLCAFLSTSTISNTLFLRPYQMQEALFVIFCYYFFKTFDTRRDVVYNGTLYINAKLMMSLALVTVFTLLTGYFALFFIGPFILYAIYHRNKARDGAGILFYMAVLCLAIVFSQTFYLKYLYGYLSPRTTDAAAALFGSAVENIKSSFISIGNSLLNHFFTYPVIAICVLCFLFLIIWRKRKFFEQKHALYIFIVSLAYTIIVMILAPDDLKMFRYIMPVFPLFILLPATMLYSIGSRKFSYIAILLFCVFFLRDALNKDRIENLFSGKLDTYFFAQDPSVPVLVLAQNAWKNADLVPYFNNDQIYYFNTSDGVNLSKSEELYLVIERIPELETMSLPHFDIEQEASSEFFTVKKLHLKKQE